MYMHSHVYTCSLWLQPREDLVSCKADQTAQVGYSEQLHTPLQVLRTTATKGGQQGRHETDEADTHTESKNVILGVMGVLFEPATPKSGHQNVHVYTTGSWHVCVCVFWGSVPKMLCVSVKLMYT